MGMTRRDAIRSMVVMSASTALAGTGATPVSAEAQKLLDAAGQKFERYAWMLARDYATERTTDGRVEITKQDVSRAVDELFGAMSRVLDLDA